MNSDLSKAENETNDRKKIFLVDDNMTNLTTGKNMMKEKYRVYSIPSANIMFDLLENVTPDIILLDIEMPDMNGYEAIGRLKREPRWSDIPVIFLTARTDENSELEGLDLGAIDYVTKPFSAPLLLKRIENHLLTETQKAMLVEFNDNLKEKVRKSAEQIFILQNTVINTVADLVEFRDGVTGGHVNRTSKYVQVLVDCMIREKIYAYEVSKWDFYYLYPATQLHDVGKIAISDLILNKPGKLTDEEFEIMKTHSAIGASIIKRIEDNAGESAFLYQARIIAGSHHEKWNGSGYPLGIRGLDIPLEGRLMAIADVYDALISARPYKSSFSADEARQIIADGSGSHFDPVLVDVFLKVSDMFEKIKREL